MTPAPNRFWTGPDGTRWRVWLEPAPRHRLRQGDSRASLTFVDMDNPKRQELRMVPKELVLEEMGEGELVGFLESEATA